MEKFTLNFCKIFSVICLVILLLGKLHFIGYSLIIDTEKPKEGLKYSDLYGMCRISAFKEQVSRNSPSPESGSYSDADILIIGDSFLENKLGDKAFKEALQLKTNYRVFDFTNVYPDAVNAPLLFLKRINPDTLRERILILETTERYTLKRIKDYPKDTRFSYSLPRVYEDVSTDIFGYADVNILIRYNYLLRDFFNFKSELNFQIFNRIINKEIGAFSLNPNLLFYNQETEFNKRAKTDEDINKFAESVSNLSKELEKYRIKLIYVVIPDKISIYNEYVYGEFRGNNYLPRVYENLQKKNINYIDLYNVFINNKNTGDWLYYKSDTHFNEKGRELLIDECIKKINEMKSGKDYIVTDTK